MAIRGDSTGQEKQYLLDMLAGAGGQVLEIGCGAGRLTGKYAARAQRLIGIDLPPALPPGHALAGLMLPAAASATALPFAAASFDVALFSLSF